MAKLKSTLSNMLLPLTGICLVAGAILTGMNQFTASPVAVAKAVTLKEAIKAIAPEFDNKPTEGVYMAVSFGGDSLKIYPAKKGGQVIGRAIESNTKKGFSGKIRVIVGFDMDDKILNYSVLQHAETPGLRARIQEWFHTDKDKQNILGRTILDGSLKVTEDGGDVDAIATATVSSRAFLGVVNRAYSVFAGVNGLTVPLQLITNKEGGQSSG